MLPLLVDAPWLRLPTYEAAISLGFAMASFALVREVRASGLPARDLYAIAVGIFPAAWFGARLFMVFEEPERFLARPWELLWPGAGWVFYGGFVCAALLVLLQARRRGLDPWLVGDTFAPVFPFGIVGGRLGCLGAGCCHGRPADWPLGVEVPWSVRYWLPGHSPPSLLGVPLHPSPLYESALGLLLFVGLTHLRRRQRFSGQTGAALLMGYGGGRAFLELFRGDLERNVHLGGWLTTSQLWGLITVGLGVALWRWREGR